VSVLAALERAVAAIATAREAIAAGIFIDLAGLDRLVEAACVEAREAPAEVDDATAKRLVALLVDLDELAGELRAQHDAAMRTPTPPHGEAAKAYKRRPQ
jgi:hypothetical protein